MVEKKAEKKPVAAKKEIAKPKVAQANPKATQTKVKGAVPAKAKATEQTKPKVVKKPAKPAAKTKGKKSKEVKAIAAKIKKKKRYLFRGRFGSRDIKKKANKKWQRWRKPRGIDIYRKQEDGLYPKPGYGQPKTIRGKHPSGFEEIAVRNEAELEKAKGMDGSAVRLAKALGKKKRKIIIEKADKQGIIVLNR